MTKKSDDFTERFAAMSERERQDAAKKGEYILEAAFLKMIQSAPFYCSLIVRMDRVPIINGKMTMAVDGIHLFYNPVWIAEQTIAETIGVLIHEAMHIAGRHPTKMTTKINHKIWNIACDASINNTILEMDQYKSRRIGLPDGTHGGEWLKYKNWMADAIYHDLMKDAPNYNFTFASGIGKDGEGDEDGGAPDMWGGMAVPSINGQPLTPDQIATLDEELKAVIQSAAEAAKAIGKLPGEMMGLIEATKKPKINWKNYIQEWVKGTMPDNYSWRRPNKKLLAVHGIYMPSMEAHGCGTGVLSIDTSGSVSDAELVNYVSEIVGLLGMMRPDRLFIIQHDAAVHYFEEWDGNPFNKLKITGRGGTHIVPVFERLEKEQITPDWMIAFTDMEISPWPKQPDFPVLWAATGDTKAPFGTYIDLRDH